MTDKNKYALVTGASSGIGQECARILAAKGYHLIIVARRDDRLKELAAEIEGKNKVKVHILAKDLARQDAPLEIFNDVKEKNLQVEVLINNAGFGLYDEFLDQKLEEINRMLNLNIVALTNLTWLFGKEMARNGKGYILQVSSVGAFQPSPLYAAYSATKSYVMLLSEALDYELKAKNVKVTTLYPGATKTEFHEVANHKPGRLVEITKMSAKEVAEAGINAMFSGRRSITPGFINWFNEMVIKFLPRSLATAIAGWVVRKGTN